MSAQQVPEENPATAHHEEMMSALFAHLIMQQTNMAMMLMGKVANPESGETAVDLDAAKLFIDLLEMLELKTKGNLSREEAQLLKQSLMSLRMTFVEAVESAPPPGEKAPPQPKAKPGQTAPADAPLSTPGGVSEDDEHRKKFSKNY